MIGGAGGPGARRPVAVVTAAAAAAVLVVVVAQVARVRPRGVARIVPTAVSPLQCRLR